jgi:hypothetical protein
MHLRHLLQRKAIVSLDWTSFRCDRAFKAEIDREWPKLSS